MSQLNTSKLHWIYLIIAGLCEVAWAVGIKFSDGFSHLYWSLFTIVFMILSFFMLAKALEGISMGTAYAIFTGTGAAGAAIIGILLLGESSSLLKIISLLILITGVVGVSILERPKEVKEQIKSSKE